MPKIAEKEAQEKKTERRDRYYYACGKRKTSIAQTRLYENGSGEITVNGKPVNEYFFGDLITHLKAPLKLTEVAKRFDVVSAAAGGGVSSQADALRHSIAKALMLFDPALRAVLKRAGFITRDARIKERKKPGLRRARRAPQWSKR